MSFGASTANRRTAKTETFGQEPDHATTNQAATPVPWFCGTKRLGISWIEDVFSFQADPVYIRMKKSREQSGWSYSAGLAFLLAHGPLDQIQRILFDRTQVYPLDGDNFPENEDGSPYESPLTLSADETDISIAGYGTLHLRRGTDTQTLDSDFIAATGHAHGGMRGLVWGWFDRLELGEGRTNLPNIEIIGSRFPVPSWFDLATSRVGTFDINPIAALADFLQNPRVYLGWPDSRLDTDTLNDIAEDCAARCLGLSAYLVDSESGDAFVTRICEHIGAVPVILPNGKFSLRLIRPTTVSLGTLDETDLTEPPRLKPQGLVQTSNEVRVNFTNARNWWRDDTVSDVDGANYELTGELRSKALDRPFVSSPIMAQVVAQTELQMLALPQASGSFRLRLSSVGNIVPGGLFRLSHGQTGLCGLPLRCETLSLPRSTGTEATIDFHVDKTVAGALFVHPPDYTPPLTPPAYVEPVEHLRVVGAWPGQTAFEEAPAGIVLAARTTTGVVGFRAHALITGSTYEEAGQSAAVAFHGTLNNALPITTTMTGEVQFRITLDGADLTLPATSEALALLDTVVAYIGDEVLSLYDITLVSAGVYDASAIRGRYGSTHSAHDAGADVFLLVSREPFVVAMPKAGIDQVFKVQPVGFAREVELADIDPYTAPGTRRSLAPLAPIGLRVGNQVHLAYSSGDTVLSWGQVPDEKPEGYWQPVYDPLTQTVLEFIDGGSTVVRTATVAAGTETFTYTSAMQATDGTGSATLEVRAYQLRNGIRSERYDTLTLDLS